MSRQLPKSLPHSGQTPDTAQSLQFLWLRLRGARSRADQRRWFRGFERAMLQHGLVSVRWRSLFCLCPIAGGMSASDTHRVVDWLIDQPAVWHIGLSAVMTMPVALAGIRCEVLDDPGSPLDATTAAFQHYAQLRLAQVLPRMEQQLAAARRRREVLAMSSATSPTPPSTSAQTASRSAHDPR